MPTTEAYPSIAPDWGAVGHYENVAEVLLPVSRAVVDAAQIKRGDSVLDVGARTGNAALLAAQAGAQVTAIDFSPRLLEVARARLKENYPDARFELADVTDLPFADGSFDAAIDVVSLMFSADREKAVAEMGRVLKPSGRIVWSGWIPEGAVVEAAGIQAATTAEVLGHPPYPYSRWGDEDEMRELFGAQGFEIQMTTHGMAYTASSPRTWMEGINQSHPIAFGCTSVLEKAGIAQQTMAKIVDMLEKRNEDPHAFKVSFRFVVGVATRRR